jgi:hypothetical protein
MIRKFGFTLLVCGLFACQQDPYNVDVERSQLKITYQNLDSLELGVTTYVSSTP